MVTAVSGARRVGVRAATADGLRAAGFADVRAVDFDTGEAPDAGEAPDDAGDPSGAVAPAALPRGDAG